MPAAIEPSPAARREQIAAVASVLADSRVPQSLVEFAARFTGKSPR